MEAVGVEVEVEGSYVEGRREKEEGMPGREDRGAGGRKGGGATGAEAL